MINVHSKEKKREVRNYFGMAFPPCTTTMYYFVRCQSCYSNGSMQLPGVTGWGVYPLYLRIVAEEISIVLTFILKMHCVCLLNGNDEDSVHSGACPVCVCMCVFIFGNNKVYIYYICLLLIPSSLTKLNAVYGVHRCVWWKMDKEFTSSSLPECEWESRTKFLQNYNLAALFPCFIFFSSFSFFHYFVMQQCNIFRKTGKTSTSWHMTILSLLYERYY